MSLTIEKNIYLGKAKPSSGGSTPTGTITITTNGEHDVTSYATADVQVPTTVPEIYRVFRNKNGQLSNSITNSFMPLPSIITNIGNFMLAYCYADTPDTSLSGAIDLSSLTSITGSYACYYMFQNCLGVTSVDMSSLISISEQYACNNMFANNLNLTSVDLSSLKTVSGSYACESMFANCNISNLDIHSLENVTGNYGCSSMFRYGRFTSIDLSALKSITARNGCSSMFDGCKSLTSVTLSSLTTLTGQSACSSMFNGCIALTSLSFPALTSSSFGTRTDQFNSMLAGCSNVTVHFPSNVQSKIGSWSSVTGGFGGTNTTVLFDLPATE